MAQFRSLLLIPALAAIALLSAASAAQSGSTSSSAPYPAKSLPNDLSGDSYKTKPLPPAEINPPSPFNTSIPADARPVEFLSRNQMTEADRALAASAQPAIEASATLAGFEFDTGKWNYQQLVCAALPSHLFLVFRGDNGPRDVSLFSASIPRVGKDHIRVIPVRRRGFSLFSPAPVNPFTVSAFNRVRADEPAAKNADWLSTGLCYAALAGAHPHTSSSPDKSSGPEISYSFPPTLEVGRLGEATVRFIDVAAARQPMQWALTFDPTGKLDKVVQIASPPYPVKIVPPLVDQQSTPQASR